MTSSQSSDTGAVACSAPGPSGARLERAERTASRCIDGRAVVISMDDQRVHVLNEIGTLVWERSDGRTLDAIVDEIVVEFDVERTRAARDVQAFAELLVGLGAARLRAPEAGSA